MISDHTYNITSYTHPLLPSYSKFMQKKTLGRYIPITYLYFIFTSLLFLVFFLTVCSLIFSQPVTAFHCSWVVHCTETYLKFSLIDVTLCTSVVYSCVGMCFECVKLFYVTDSGRKIYNSAAMVHKLKILCFVHIVSFHQ